MAAKPIQSHSLKDRIAELEVLVQTISRGKLQWESTFDVITDPVVIIDENYTILRANKAMAKACGLNVTEVIGKKCYQVFAGYSKGFPQCPVPLTLADKRPHGLELELFPKNNRRYFATAYLMSEVTPKSQNQIVLHYRDVTEEKALQQQLIQTDKMAAIGTLAGGIAHEINNPLGAILAHVQLVVSELEKNHPCQESLKQVEDAVLRCKKIVRDLLDFSRQNFDEQMQPVNLNSVVQKTLDLIEINARYSQIVIDLDLDKNLPNIFGHFHRLQQVILNIVTNAIHAMMTVRGGKLTIHTFVNKEDDFVCLKVSDTGHGIAEKNLDKIFDPFFTTKDQGEGTGLGLAISYRIIKEHEGQIEVESQENKGTTFLISFPIFSNKGEQL